MSKATKRKHVTKEILDDFVLPEGDKIIVKVSSQVNIIVIIVIMYVCPALKCYLFRFLEVEAIIYMK